MSKFSLTCRNNSPMTTQFCLFQRAKAACDEAVSLVWMCQTCAAGAATRFTWSDELYFVWGFAQSLRPGDNLFVAQAKPVEESRHVRLQMRGDVLSFQAAPPEDDPDGLLISTDRTLPAGVTAVGLGMQAERMCGTAALVVPAGPNCRYQFDGAVEYCLAAVPSRKLELGDVPDPTLLRGAAKVSFPYGIRQLIASLNDQNQISFTRPMYCAGGACDEKNFY